MKCKQIDNPPIILVGNKADLVFDDNYSNEKSTNTRDATISIASGYMENKNNSNVSKHVKTESASVSASASASASASTSGQVSEMTVYKDKKDMRQVSSDEILQLCQEFDIPYVQCSAKTKLNFIVSRFLW